MGIAFRAVNARSEALWAKKRVDEIDGDERGYRSTQDEIEPHGGHPSGVKEFRML
jgi:hypothetical protein